MSSLSIKDLLIGAGIFVITKLVTDAYAAYKDGFAKLGTCPGKHRLWIHPVHTLAFVISPFFPPRGWLAHFGGKFELYAKEGSTILSGLVVWPWDTTPMFWLADADAIKAVTSDRSTFRKEVEVYDVLEIYGRNLVTTEGDQWRRHLAIAGPAFNEANYALTWNETRRIIHEWFDELDSDSSITVGKQIDITAAMTRATLLVISASGFGMNLPWSAFSPGEKHTYRSQMNTESHKVGKRGATMPFHTALALTIDKLFLKVLTPEFVYELPFRIPLLSDRLEEAQIAFDDLKAHMEDLVETVRGSDLSAGAGSSNLLGRLVEANEETRKPGGGSTKGTLTDEELFSNIFVFLLAGHETISHTLSFAIMLLALNPEVQHKLREEVLHIWPTLDDGLASISKNDFERLEYTLAFFRETMRCFPAVPYLNKIVEGDAILMGTRFSHDNMSSPSRSYDGSLTNVQVALDESKEYKFSVHVPKGSVVTMDIWAIHMNPLYWGDDAHLFKPDRFVDTSEYKWPRDAFLPFSAGARGCIGHRLATTESVCLLACLVRRYEILPPEGTEIATLTEADKRRLFKWEIGATLTPKNSRVRLRKYKPE